MSDLLVNFRVPEPLLERFDALCRASDRTRTQVLREMMRNRLASASRSEMRVANGRPDSNRFERAIEAQTTSVPVEGRRTWSEAVYRRLKPFSSFDQPGV